MRHKTVGARGSIRLGWLAVIAAMMVSITSLPAQAGTPPQITSFSPQSGPVGTSVTINGTDLGGTSSVMFNGTTATFHVNGAGTKITTTVPGGAATGPISVQTPNGTAMTTNFSVTGGVPTITSFNPNSGSVGTTVAIHGTNFTGVNSVKFNGTLAAFTFVTSIKVSAVVPNGGTTGKITLTTPSGTATSGTNFNVTGTGPTISSFNPASGNVGTTVTIHGTNFTGVSSVKFNGTSATFTFVNSGKVMAVVPNGATTGKITLTTPAGTATSAGTFTVLAAHSRTISLSLGRGRLRATGHVGVNDGYGACKRFVPVVIKRYHAGRWRWITTTSTGQQGNFRASIPDRSGRYRARAIKIQLVNGAVCRGRLSNVVRHHR